MATLYGHSTPRGITVARPTPLGAGTRVRALAVWLGCQLRTALIAIGEHSHLQPRAFALPSDRYDSPELRKASQLFGALHD